MRHGTVRPIAQISSNVNKERENQKENEIWKKTANQSNIRYETQLRNRMVGKLSSVLDLILLTIGAAFIGELNSWLPGHTSSFKMIQNKSDGPRPSNISILGLRALSSSTRRQTTTKSFLVKSALLLRSPFFLSCRLIKSAKEFSKLLNRLTKYLMLREHLLKVSTVSKEF